VIDPHPPFGVAGRRLKVAYLVPPSLHFAGIERVTHDLASALAEQADVPADVTVLYFTDYSETREAPYRRIVMAGDRVRQVPRALHAVAARENFDVIVIPQFEIAILCLAYNRLHGRRDRIVLHLHGNPDIERATSVKARLLFTVFGLAPRLFAGIVAVSPTLARATERMLGGARVDYLPNPVRQLQPSVRTDDAATRARFVSIGRLARQKGHDIAIRAMRTVVDAHPEARLTILGEGEERLALEALIAQLDLAGHVHLQGVVADPTVALARAGTFVIASRWEGFGVVIVEALSAGLPVIAARCDFGPEDILTTPVLGTLVPPEDPAALAAAMIRRIDDPAPGRPDERIAHAARYARAAVVDEHARYLAYIVRA
jgi:glycosyltransferase involved in cell wall biosynthesis